MEMVEIVEKLGELGILRLNKVVGSYYSIYCPIHNNGEERNPSCGILLHDESRNGNMYPAGFCHCFSCQHADTLENTISKILEMRGISNRSGLEFLEEHFPGFQGDTSFDYLVPRDLVKSLNSKFAVSYLNSKTLKYQKKFISEEELKKYRFTVSYMYERKLTDEIIDKFDVGVDLHYVPEGRVKEVPCVTFPVRDSKGNTLFVFRRSIKNKNFYLPQGIEKPVYGLYELDKDATTVVLCESIFNALTCYVYGVPALALLGTGTPSQIKKLRTLGVKKFILGLDPDEAGDRGKSKLRKNLKDIALIQDILRLDDGRDLNDLTKEEFYEVIGMNQN